MKNKDVVIESFNQVNVSRMKMPFIVLYDHPKDYSENYVARLFDVNKPTNVVIVSKDLEELKFLNVWLNSIEKMKMMKG